MRRRWAVSLLPLLLCLARLASFAADRIDKLGRDCTAGRHNACADLVDIAKTHKEGGRRTGAVKALTNQALLADIAKSAPNWDARGEAVRKLTDQATLAFVARNDANVAVRQAAVWGITDQGTLESLARTDSSPDVREAAIAKIIDQSLLAEIAGTDSDFRVSEKAIQRLTDRAAFAKLLATNSSPYAFEKYLASIFCVPSLDGLRVWQTGGAALIAPELFLGPEAGPGRQPEMRDTVLSLTANALGSMGMRPASDQTPTQSRLEIIARGEALNAYYNYLGLPGGERRYPGAKWAGLIRLSFGDRCVYSWFLEDGIPLPGSIDETSYRYPSSAPFREALEVWIARQMTGVVEVLRDGAAATGLSVEAVFESIQWAELRLEATRQLTDQAALAWVLRTETWGPVREEALRRLSDQGLLAEFVLATENANELYVAFEKLTDQAELATLARTASRTSVRFRAVQRLTDQAVLADLARNDADSGVRLPAVRRLTDQAVLAAVARADSEYDIREEAVKRLTDRAVLTGVARTDSDWRVRMAANNRLKELKKAP